MFLLDTDTLSDWVNHPSGKVAKRLEYHRLDELAISAITVGEVLQGLRAREVSQLKMTRAIEALRRIATAEVGAEVASQYAMVKTDLLNRGTPIGPNDFWIAAHALALGATLVTNNTREFKRVKGLKLANWLE